MNFSDTMHFTVIKVQFIGKNEKIKWLNKVTTRYDSLPESWVELKNRSSCAIRKTHLQHRVYTHRVVE